MVSAGSTSETIKQLTNKEIFDVLRKVERERGTWIDEKGRRDFVKRLKKEQLDRRNARKAKK